MSIQDLDTEDRLRLIRFVCAFAWSDLSIADAERDLIHKLVTQLGLDADEAEEVEGWLKHPPDPDSVDPQDVPLEHRQLFLKAALDIIGADGSVEAEELEILQLFEQLLH